MVTNGEAVVTYREKAKTFRSLAGDLPEDARTALLRVADEYERMAAKAAERSPTEPAHPAFREDR